MDRDATKVILADIVLVVALLYILQDLGWRLSYAASVHSGCPGTGCAYSPSFSYGILTRVFTMYGNHVSLVSPPALDWVQATVYALVAVNVLFAYKLYTAWRERSRFTGPEPKESTAA